MIRTTCKKKSLALHIQPGYPHVHFLNSLCSRFTLVSCSKGNKKSKGGLCRPPVHLCVPLPPCSAACRANWFHLATSILLSDRPGSLFALVKIDYWRKLQIRRRTKNKTKKLLVAQIGTISSSSLMMLALFLQWSNLMLLEDYK